MRRNISVLTATALTAAMMAASALPAFAASPGKSTVVSGECIQNADGTFTCNAENTKSGKSFNGTFTL